jgi:hypothetical protein
MKIIFISIISLFLFVGCDGPTVQELREQEKQAKIHLQSITEKRDKVRAELQSLYVQRKTLVEDEVKRNTTITNMVYITNIVTSLEQMFDGRISARIIIENQFNTIQIFSMPYSSREFIFKSNGRVYYGYCTGTSTNVDLYFRIFE